MEAIVLVAVVAWFLVRIPVLALLYAHGRQLREKRQRLTRRRSSEEGRSRPGSRLPGIGSEPVTETVRVEDELGWESRPGSGESVLEAVGRTPPLT